MNKRKDALTSLKAYYVTLPRHLKLAEELWKAMTRELIEKPHCPSVGCVSGIGKTLTPELFARMSFPVRAAAPEVVDEGVTTGALAGVEATQCPAPEGRLDDWCGAWARNAGLQLPLTHPHEDRFWPLTEDDVYIAALYFAACRAHFPPAGTALFAGTRNGAPHLLTQWYPASFWMRLSSLGFRRALRELPHVDGLPSVSQVQTMLRIRYDHNLRYRFYRDAHGKARWSLHDELAERALARRGTREQ